MILQDANNKQTCEAIAKLISWIQTWKTKKGAYNGFVVHRHDLKRMFKTHDSPWSQGPIIQGYLNLFKKTGDNKWLFFAIEAADLQIARLQEESGKYIYAGYENDKFTSLICCSLANCALLNLSDLLRAKGKPYDMYVNTVKKNSDKYIIGVLWNEKFGAFRFGDVEYHQQPRYIANMNSVAIESLIKLSLLTDDNKYIDKFALRVGEWLLTQQVFSDTLENGGISYSHIQPRILISIYTALALRGLDDLYEITGDNKYLMAMEKASDHLINLKDPHINLFYEGIYNGRITKKFYFVAGAGIILKAIDDTMRYSDQRYNVKEILRTLIGLELPSGGFQNFIGYDTTDNNRRRGDCNVVWEDVVPTLGWNAHLFEYLTQVIHPNSSILVIEYKKVRLNQRRFWFFENRRVVIIVGKSPIRSLSWGLYIYFKKIKYGLICNLRPLGILKAKLNVLGNALISFFRRVT